MAAPSWRRPGTAEALNHFKKDYRARFCHGEGKKIDVQPGQNILKLVEDCFESCGSDLTISSPCGSHCSTPLVGSNLALLRSGRSDVRTPHDLKVICANPLSDLTEPKAGLTNSVKKACNYAESSPASPLKTTTSSKAGRSCESLPTPAVHNCVAISKETESSVSKRETNNILKAVETLCQSPAVPSDSEDDNGAVGSSLLVKEASSPGPVLRFDGQNTPPAVKSRAEVKNGESPQAGRAEQGVLLQGTEHAAASSVQKEKSFSSAVLAAVATGKLGKRYSSSISPPSPPLVKDQETEIENECEFLIDESDDASCNSWISIPHKKKKSKKIPPSTTVSKCQPSKKTENKKGKSREVQVEALTKQKTDDSDAREFKGATESDPVSSSAGKARKSRKENSTHKGKTEKSALRQGSPNKKKEMSSKPEGEELMSPAGLEVNAPDTEQCKTRVMSSEDSPLPSAGHQKQQTVSSKENLKSPKDPQSASKTSQPLVPKKQTAKQKVPKGKVAKRLTESVRKKLKKSVKKSSNKKTQLQRQESSDSEPGEEEPEQEPVKLDEVFTSPLQQKLQTPGSQKLAKSEKPKNVLQSLESLSAGNDALVQALQYLVDSIKKSGKKQMSPKSSGKTPKKTHHRMSEGACSSPEDTDSQTPSDSSSEQDMARKKQKLPEVKMESKKRKRTMQTGPKDSFAVVDAASHESGPVLEHGVKMVSGLKSPEQDSVSTDNSEELNSQLRALLSDEIARHKIVLPSNTPNVRRTKRIRLRPLEYWRGERINYTMSPSGGLVINGIVRPETEPDRKIKQRKCDHNQKRDEKRSEIPANLGQSLADTTKPTVVFDPVTKEEVLLECVNTGTNHSCFFKDENVEIYKKLNTSAFATGKLILKPLKEKGHQFVHMDTIAFHVIHGKIIATLHKTSYYLTAGDFFYVPAGNGYNIRNLLNEESILLFTQLKDRPKARSMLWENSSS